MNERFEITQDMTGVVTIRETENLSQGRGGYGCSRPTFEAFKVGTGPRAGSWIVNLADGDNFWQFATEAEAGHAANVLQAVMNRHLAAAREEGRREALGIRQLMESEPPAEIVGPSVTFAVDIDHEKLNRVLHDVLTIRAVRPSPAVEPTTPGEAHAEAVARAEADPSLRVACDVCEGRTTTRTVGPDGVTAINTPCPRCRGRGWRPEPVPVEITYNIEGAPVRNA